MRHLGIFMTLALASVFSVRAEVRPAAWITDGMVIQRGQQVTLRGTAEPGEVVELDFDGVEPLTTTGKRFTKSSVTAPADGRWSITLPSLKAGGPFVLTLGDKRLTDIMVGDVYLCSGQSNMELPTSRVMDKYAMEINASVNKKVRLLHVRLATSYDGPAADVTTDGWKTLNKENAAGFSATAYFFAREMQAANSGVAIGVIEAAVGGTPIEAWLSREQLLSDGFISQVSQLDINADADYRQMVENYGKQAGDRWEAILAQKEASLAQDWKAENFDDSAWETVDATSDSWSQDNSRPLNGAHWFRKVIDVSAAQAAMPAVLRLGTLVDMDEVWVNGVKVGVTYYQYPPRIYDIPEGVLHEGRNVIAVRLVSQGGKPAFVPEKYRGIFFGGNRWLCGSNRSKIDFDNQWRYSYAVSMPGKSGVPFFYYTPTVLYNAMVAPLSGAKFAGVLWYQGESNIGREGDYAVMLKGLMSNWRQLFGNPDMKFVIIELADYGKPVGPGWRNFQQMQREVAEADPRAALAEIHDLGEWNDIHPLDKKTVGIRAARVMNSIK